MKYLKTIILSSCLTFILFNSQAAEPQKRAHSPQLTAGLASESQNGKFPYGRRFPAACCGELQCKDNSHPRNLSLDEIMDRIENRYAAKGFSATFSQESTIKAMDITDTASGKLFIKPPGMMRWEYEKPDQQLIITNGKRLWVYRQDDNQVMVGTAPYFFGNGKGGGFLSDMKIIREKFNIALDDKSIGKYYILKLIPKEKMFDISLIYLSISINTFDIVQITTYNLYDDETKIYLKNIEFKKHIDDSMFYFEIPEGADILQLDG